MLYRNSVSIVVVLDFSKYQLSYCFRNDRVWKNVKLRPVSFRFVARNGLCENPRSHSSKSGLEQLEGCSAVWENSLHSAISENGAREQVSAWTPGYNCITAH